MKYRLLAVDKLRERYIAAAVADFRARLRGRVTLEEFEIPPSHGGDPARAMREESERILARIAPHDTVWLLERTGRALSSLDLVECWRKAVMSGFLQS